MKRAICLSGGGAKGSYEIGVWKALRKLNIKYDIVTGTSVGALNGALMVQKTFHKAEYLWKKMDFSLLFSKEDLKEFDKKKDTKSLVKMYAKNVLNGGMNVKELEDLVKEVLDLRKITNSKIEFGIITVNMKTLKPKIIRKEEIDKDKLCDYLIASASCYPFFQKKKIDNNEYIDGGFYDNLPINLAIDLGAEEIIAVDLKAVGRVQPVKDKSIPITYISPRNNIGNFLVFDKTQSNEAMDYGYNDTMKVFNKLEGNIFTFKKNSLSKNYQRKGEKLKIKIQQFCTFDFDNSLAEDLLKVLTLKRLTNSKIEDTLNDTIEFLGEAFNLKQNIIYSMFKYHKELLKELAKTEVISKKMIEEKKIPGQKEIIKYFYNNLKLAEENDKIKQELCALVLIFKKEFLASLYLSILED